MIQLRDDLNFAEGGRRICYIHPEDAAKCVKILSPNGNPKKRRNEGPWYKKLRPLSMFDDNLRELKSFKELERKSDAVWSHFPRCYGIQPTNLGDGIVTDLIRDEDGEISQTVRQYVTTHGKTPALYTALGTFFDLLRRRLIVTRDILDHNLVVQMIGSTLTIVMIDGFGSVEVIPLSKWSNNVALNKVGRKIERFQKRYDIQGIESFEEGRI